MLNYILPPIIIVISAAILIMFLFRKASELPEQEIATREPGSSRKKFSFIFSAAGQFGLKILERMIHRLKLGSLKFHNISNDWFQSIREKRQQKSVLEREMVKISEEKNVVAERHDSVVRDEELQDKREMRPMIREAVARPQSQIQVKEKNKLEDALIKRIAINPRDIEAYERLGDYYLESANMHDSLECFKQVLRLSPTHHKARLRIRRLEKALK